MSIRKLNSSSSARCAPKKGIVWCSTERGGDGRDVHRHFRSEGDAKLHEIKVKAERIGGEPVVRRTRRTFRDFAEDWRRSMTWKDTDNARYSLNRAYAIIGDRQLVAVDGLALQSLQTQLLENGARSSADLTMHYVKRVMRRAHADGLLAKDPTIGVRMPRRDSLDTSGKVTAEQVPTVDEALAIVAGAPLAYRAGVALGIGCGLRVGEVLGLTPSRVDLAAGKITIDRQYQRGRLDSPKTWRGVRTIEPPDMVLTELRRAVRPGMPADLPLFTGARGGTLRRDDFYARAWRPALVAAGLDSRQYKFHSARHFAVSNMLAHGVSVVEVAAYVGDGVETVTKVYSHFLRQSKSMAKSALDLTFAEQAVEALRDKSATSDDPTGT